jgi:hypothetical protein
MDLEQLRGWLDLYGRVWEEADPDGVIELFTPDAIYRETPFAEPMRGREAIRAYWKEATDRQEDIGFEHDIVSVSPAVARWRASFAGRDGGSRITLDGVFLLEFDPENLCSSLLEWWHLHEEPRA